MTVVDSILDFIRDIAALPQALEIFAFIIVFVVLWTWGRNQNSQNALNRGLLKQNEKLTERGIAATERGAAANEELAKALSQLATSFTTGMSDLKAAIALQADVDKANTRAILGFIDTSLNRHNADSSRRFESIILGIGMVVEGISAGRAYIANQLDLINLRINRLEHHTIGIPLDEKNGIEITVTPVYVRMISCYEDIQNEFS